MSEYDQDLARIVEQLNRAAPGGGRVEKPPGPQSFESLDRLLHQALRQNASDILLVAGSGVVFRVNGALTQGAPPVLENEDIRRLMLPLLSTAQLSEFESRKSLDFCFERDGMGRFRANVHRQRGTVAAAIRLLPARIPTLDSLNLPAALSKLVERRKGLVLVTGAAGSGKSTTLAALIDLINTRRRDHIVTIEDPVEYQHQNRSSVVEQIEVGTDAPDFASALRGILRQSPDVILVGEMRDAETMATALSAAETGHLVFSTLHTNDCPQAVSRILDTFPSASQSQIRQQLSLALLAVVAQQLVPGADGFSRYPACEIMVANDAVRNLIRRGEDHQLRSQITIGRADGMATMEQSLAELVRVGRIHRDTAMAHCFRPDDLRHHLTL
ncbi:MAG TPA: type IV pili twitching motility protein PilT [Solibacterales bacterium]|nr:type IV pili twitching motility protein PilT [Bryobacterales bacterium]